MEGTRGNRNIAIMTRKWKEYRERGAGKNRDRKEPEQEDRKEPEQEDQGVKGTQGMRNKALKTIEWNDMEQEEQGLGYGRNKFNMIMTMRTREWEEQGGRGTWP